MTDPKWWQISIYAVTASPIIMAAADILDGVTGIHWMITAGVLALVAGWAADPVTRIYINDFRRLRAAVIRRGRAQ
jgi:hypothetical protein